MITTLTMPATEYNDATLVTESLAGDRDAFGRIVAQHQALICSLAYSATGSLAQSEDLAQQTFVTAWKCLPGLREPAKLRPWLCGIARNLIGKALRQDSREPVHAARPLEEANESASNEPLPLDHMISKEEESILWRSLERIPGTYREPLVLFYREHQSVERVAEALDLTEVAVKQRLSRGRKLLQEQVLAFVEGALEQSTPGKAFTLGVLAALPFMATSAKAAAVGATAAKGGALAKSAGLAGLCNAVLGPLFVFFGIYFGYRLDRADANSPQRRALTTKYYRILVVCIVVFLAAVFSLALGNGALIKNRPGLYIELLLGIGVAYLFVVMALTVWMRRSLRKIRRQEMEDHHPAFTLVPLFEYRSKLALLGLPLIHIRFRGGLERGPVKAWIAAGDSALGALFAFGGVAVAPISFGGVSVGLLTLGGFAVGLMAFGGFALAPFAVGGMAIGWKAVGGCAIAWVGAQGGAAAAHEFAVGGVALARHANDADAKAFFANSGFFRTVLAALPYSGWLNLSWFLVLLLWWRRKKIKS
ncbi:MAG: sigma-70 family RNA polymerase sigma factor [Verrucomicrobiota bacterium]